MQVFALGTILGFVQHILGTHYILFLIYLGLNTIDIVTAIMGALVTRTYSSTQLVLGLARKLGYWFVIAVSFALVSVMQELGEILSVNLSALVLIGWVVLSVLIFHEIRSILQNVTQLGIQPPAILADVLGIVEKEVEEKFTSGFDGKMVVNTTDPAKDVFRMEFDGDIAELADKDKVTFKVEHED